MTGTRWSRVLPIACMSLCLAVAYGVLQQFPNSGDEFAYLFQSHLFSSGSLDGPGFPSAVREAFELDHVLNGDFRLAKYSPGWPAILALGQLAGAPWLVNPILAAICVFLVGRLAASATGQQTGGVGASVALLFSPFFLLNGASLHSHMSALAALTASTYFATKPTRSSTVLSGLLWSVAFLVRPYDALIFALSLPLLLPVSAIRIWALGAIAGPILSCCYNAVQFGGPFISGYAAYRPTFARLYPDEGMLPEPSLANLVYWWEHLKWVGELWQWAPVTLLFGVIGTLQIPLPSRKQIEPRTLPRWAVAYAMLCVASVFLCKPSDGDSFGPRYLFGALLPLSVLADSGFQKLSLLGERTFKGVVLVVGALSVVQAGTFAEFFSDEVEQRQALFHAVEREGAENAIVLIPRTEPREPHWFTRNMSTVDPILYARDLGPQFAARLVEAFPNRTLYRFIRSSSTEGGLRRVNVSAGGSDGSSRSQQRLQ